MAPYTTIAGLDRAQNHARRHGAEASVLAYRAVSTVSEVLGGAAAALAEWRKRRQAIRELEALDDRLLRDIGIERSEIPATVDALLGGAARARAAAKPTPARASGTDRLLAGLRAIAERHRERRKAREAARALGRLDARLLDDIAVTRGDVRALEAGQITLAELEARRAERLPAAVLGRPARAVREMPHRDRDAATEMRSLAA